MAETIFGKTLTLSSGRIIPTRWVAEQHVKEDLGFIPSFADWAKSIRPEPWMGRTQRIEREVDPDPAGPARMVDSSYLLLGLAPEAKDADVVRASVLLFHPTVRREQQLRHSRKRFYRHMLAEHSAVRRRISQGLPTGPVVAE